MVEEVMDLDYSNSLFIEMNRPLQPLWVTGVLLCRMNAPGTSPEHATPYRWPAVEVTLTLFAGVHVGKNSVNVELGDGVLAFVAQEEVAGPAAIHKSVLGQAACAGRVFENVEGCFLICVAVGVIEAHAMTGQVLQSGLAKIIRKDVSGSLARGSVAAPTIGIVPLVATAGGIHVDADETDVPVAQLRAMAVDPAAALGERNIFVFRNQELGIEPERGEGGHNTPGDFPVERPLEETAVRRVLSCSFPAVSVVN